MHAQSQEHNSIPDYSQTYLLEDLYLLWKSNPSQLDEGIQRFFEGFDLGIKNFPLLPSEDSQASQQLLLKQIGVLNLIYAYRSRGHLVAKINPVRQRRDHNPQLELEHFGLNSADLETIFPAGREVGLGPATLRTIIAHLQKVYCGSTGYEYDHKRKPEILKWFRERLECPQGPLELDIDQKRTIFSKLNEAEVFEKFVQARYVGQKRFSLEGSEVLIPALEFLIRKGAQLGAHQFLFGSAHRGRLNLLANIFGKTYQDIFSEFEDFSHMGQGAMDVKYHMGYSAMRELPSRESVKLTLAFNPSHLEAVNPVVLGMVRSKVEQWYYNHYPSIVPVLIHGDAAIAGQGIVYETLQMTKLPGYTVGGTIHVVINNQIGFTTSPDESRSTIYATDVAKSVLAPVLHVNGQDPEAVVQAMLLAIEFRQTFGEDIFVDIICFRKYGHNEADEPRFTQPLLYKKLADMPSVREVYRQKLLESGVIESKLAEEMEESFNRELAERMQRAREKQKAYTIKALHGKWTGIRFSRPEDFDSSPTTGIELDTMQHIGNTLVSLPSHIHPIRKVIQLLDDRKTLLEKGKVNWALGELMAYGSLIAQGFTVRLSGEDVRRGTFSHRHAVILDEETEEAYIALNHLAPEQSAKFQIFNSHLSEYGVLGFEHGYSLSAPHRLNLWEAQFGDFSNGAQIILDQFISSAEEKWRLASGLVLLLPHGYEGQGPEHSSARVERYLQLCAQYNMQVVNCSTPANFFHVIRRQLLREFRKPLVVFTPKSLLRHPECVSELEELGTGTYFREIIDDTAVDNRKVNKVLLCSGKIYYELAARRQELGRTDVALVRLEQLYPLPRPQIRALVAKYRTNNWYWVQEEPINMGAWDFLLRSFHEKKLKVISRPQMASPAEGSLSLHKRVQSSLIENCFQD